MASSGLRSLSLAELERYADDGRRGVAEGLEYASIRRRLEQAYCVTADDGTMRQWLRTLGVVRVDGDAGAPTQSLAMKSLAELEPYDTWARQKLRHELLSYAGLRRALEREQGATAANGTM